MSEQEQPLREPSLIEALLLLVDRLDVVIDQNAQLIEMLAGDAGEAEEPKLDLAGRPIGH